ncbi:MAG: GNAT family N-acetyltransferase [Dehalococcoidales bacterium]|nr:MAG: GNAT family N-acetyltransferase [Dehalococcoidales bacterium]
MDYRQALQRIIYRIEYNLKDDISLAQLSEQAHISMYHFSRLFTIYTGLSPMGYVRRRRMLHAAEAIHSGEEILPVAMRYGYSSHSGFSKAFKKMFGYAPSLYRKIGTSHVPPCINLYTENMRAEGKVLKACETERLFIRNFRPADWKQIQALAIDKETSEGAKYDLSWPTSDDESLKMAEFLSGTDFFWAVYLKENEKLTGLIAFNSIDENRTLDLGHVFHTDYILEQDIMTEALRRMVQYAFDELEIDRITTHNAADWKGQIEPLYRLGMKKTGEWTGPSPANTDKSPIKIKVLDLGITRGDWEKSRK